MDYYKASDLYDYVLDVISDEHGWPIPRRALKGLRLRQLSDAVKLHLAKVYIEGLIAPEDYENIKGRWGSMMLTLPSVFVRDEEWEKFRELDSENRRIRLLGVSSKFCIDRDEMNEEERELFDAESFEGFTNYLEKVNKLVEDPWQHVLGHLSQGVIYIDDAIPIFPPGSWSLR